MQLIWDREQKAGKKVEWGIGLVRPIAKGDKVHLLEKLSFYLQVATINQVVKLLLTSIDI